MKARLAQNRREILAEMSERIDIIDPAEFTRELARITQPTLVVAAASSPPAFSDRKR